MSQILLCENVGVRPSAGRELLSDIDLSVHAGEVAVVMGAAGSGKSLLAAVAAGLRQPNRGRVRILGMGLTDERTGEGARRRRRIGWCAARPDLLPHLSAVDHVALPLLIAGTRRASARSDAAELLAWLGGENVRSGVGAAPSPAERVRIGVARAVIARPALAVLDEPLRHGDVLLAQRLPTLFGELARGGTGIVVTTGSMRIAEVLGSSSRYVLAEGRLARAATTRPAASLAPA